MLSFTKALPVWAQTIRRSAVVTARRRVARSIVTVPEGISPQQHQRGRVVITQEAGNTLLSALSTSTEPAIAYLDLREQAPQLLAQVPHDVIGRFFEFAVRHCLPSVLSLLVKDVASQPGAGVASLGAPPGHQRRKAALRGLIRGAASKPIQQQQQQQVKPLMTKLEQEAVGSGLLFEESQLRPNLRLLNVLPTELLVRTFAVLLEPEPGSSRPLPLPEELSYAQARSLARQVAATRDVSLAPLMGALLEHIARPFTAKAHQDSIEKRWSDRHFPGIAEGASLVHFYLSLPARTHTAVYETFAAKEELTPHQVALRLVDVFSLDRESSVGLALATSMKDGQKMRQCLVQSYNLAVRMDSHAKLSEAELTQRLDQAVFETTLLGLCARLFARPPEPHFEEAATALLSIEALQAPQDSVPRFVTVQARQLVLRAMLTNQHVVAVGLCSRLARILVSTQPRGKDEALEQYDYQPGQPVLLESRWLEDLFDQCATIAPDSIPTLLLPLVQNCAPGALALHLGSSRRVVEAFELLEQMNLPARRSELEAQTVQIGVALGFWTSPIKSPRLRNSKQREELHRKLDATYDESQRARIVAWAARGGYKHGAKDLYVRWAGEGPVCKSWKGTVQDPPSEYEAPGVVQSSAVLSAMVNLFSADHNVMRRRDERAQSRRPEREKHASASSPAATAASTEDPGSTEKDEVDATEEASLDHFVVPLDMHETQSMTSYQRTRAIEDMAFAKYVVSRFRGAHAMPHHSHHNLTSLAHACFRVNQTAEAFLAFAQLLLRRVVPDSYDIATLLNGMAEHDVAKTVSTFLRHISTGPSWLSKNSHTGIEPTESQYTVLLAQCIQQGRLDLGQTLLNSATQKGLADTLAIKAPALLLRVLEEDQRNAARPSGILRAVMRLLRQGWKPEPSLLAWLAHRAATRPSKLYRDTKTSSSSSSTNTTPARPRRAVAGDEALAATHLLMLSVSTGTTRRLDMRTARDVIQALHNQAAYITHHTRMTGTASGGKWNEAGRERRLTATRTAIDRLVRLLRWSDELKYEAEVTLRRGKEPNVLEFNMLRSLVYLYLRARDAVGALEVLSYMRDVGFDLSPEDPRQSGFCKHFAATLDSLAQGDVARQKEWRERLRAEVKATRTKEWWNADAPAADLLDEMDKGEWEGEYTG